MHQSRETRAALVEHFANEHFVHPSGRFAPLADELLDWIRASSATDVIGAGGGDGGQADDPADEQEEQIDEDADHDALQDTDVAADDEHDQDFDQRAAA